MKIKIRTFISAIIIFLFFLCLLFDYHMFYMIDYWALFKNNSMCFITSLIGIFLMLIVQSRVIKEHLTGFSWIFKISYLVIVAFILEFFYSVIKYPSQPISITLIEHISLLYICWTAPLLYVLEQKKDRTFILKLINIVALIWYVVIIFQSVYYLTGKGMIFNTSNYTGDLKSRYYGLRLGLGSIGNVAIIYNFDCVYNKKNQEKKYLFNIIMVFLGIYSMMFIQQTRAYTAIVLLSLCFCMVVGSRKIDKKIFLYITLILAIVYLSYSGVFINFISSFISASSNEILGTTIRLNSIDYYLECFFNNPLFGNGFANYRYSNIQYGPNGTAFYSDVGIFGLLAECGLMSIFFYILPVSKMAKYGLSKKNDIREKSLSVPILFYIIATSFTLIMTDNGRTMLIPIVFSYYMSLWNNTNCN